MRRRTKATVATGGCLWHNRSNLGYLAFHQDAERRDKAGERQSQCADCGLWLWPHEMGTPAPPDAGGEA